MKLKRIFCIISALSILFCGTFCVNVSAAKNKKVKVKTPTSFSVKAETDSVNISWKKIYKAKGYIVSRSSTGKKWKRIATIEGNKTYSYTDENVDYGDYFYYRIKAFKNIDGKIKYSKATATKSIMIGMAFSGATSQNAVALHWKRVKAAKGYEVYCSVNSEEFKRIKRLTNNKYVDYTATNLDTENNKYTFYIMCYRMVNGKRDYFYQSDYCYSNSLESIMNGAAGEPKNTVKIANVQGDKVTSGGSVTLSANDKKIFKKFAKNNFTTDMSPYQRARIVFNYIHYNVTYAKGSLYSKIDGSSYVDAIFNKNLGQCVQYNGAMAQFLAYLGYDTKIIWGWRGTSMDSKWQHFWCQVNLNGKTYVVETGNEGEDGSWGHFFEPYKNTSKYIKCGKVMN